MDRDICGAMEQHKKHLKNLWPFKKYKIIILAPT